MRPLGLFQERIAPDHDIRNTSLKSRTGIAPLECGFGNIRGTNGLGALLPKLASEPPPEERPRWIMHRSGCKHIVRIVNDFYAVGSSGTQQEGCDATRELRTHAQDER